MTPPAYLLILSKVNKSCRKSALAARNHIKFLLNDDIVVVEDLRSTDTLLDFLRINRRLTGTKEGCAEGDCGACTVLVGRRINGRLKYETVNACIRFLATLDACHVVTVEWLSEFGETLHPIQKSLVDHHGSQCGFCTPGIVMSLYGLFLQNPEPGEAEIEKALQGNLCRCTGYQPIINAAVDLAKRGGLQRDQLVARRTKITKALQAIGSDLVEITGQDDAIYIPTNADEFAKIRARHPNSTVVAGSTDVGLWVTKNFAEISPAIFIYKLDDLAFVRANGKEIEIGALTSYSKSLDHLARQIPDLLPLWLRIGGEQVRNMGTIGGNIANGSPIGDTPPPFIALDARLTLRKGGRRRTIPLEKFFIEYGRQDLRPGEFVESVTVPKPRKDEHFACYKISKRREEDITAVLGAFLIKVDGNNIVRNCRIAFGGMAATPKRARSVERFLVGRQFNRATTEAAQVAFEADFEPLSDWRASATYRMTVAQNLLKRFMIEVQGHEIQIGQAPGAR